MAVALILWTLDDLCVLQALREKPISPIFEICPRKNRETVKLPALVLDS